MKTLITTLLVALLGAATPTLAQSPQYKQAMTDALTKLNSFRGQPSAADLLTLANQFERIASVESGEWLPRY